MNYGLTQMEKGNYSVALEYFQRALIYTPNYATLEINLGIVNGVMNNAPEAERHFLRAISLAPNDDQTHFYYGRWLFQTGRGAQSIKSTGISRAAQSHTRRIKRSSLQGSPLSRQCSRHASLDQQLPHQSHAKQRLLAQRLPKPIPEQELPGLHRRRPSRASIQPQLRARLQQPRRSLRRSYPMGPRHPERPASSPPQTRFPTGTKQPRLGALTKSAGFGNTLKVVSDESYRCCCVSERSGRSVKDVLEPSSFTPALPATVRPRPASPLGGIDRCRLTVRFR